MNLVVDTNIVFSALISKDALMVEIMLSPKESFTFFAPELLVEELDRYAFKLRKASRLSQEDFVLLQDKVLQKIELISEALISEIAYALGFNETTHFNNFFKKHTNQSPLKFRNV